MLNINMVHNTVPLLLLLLVFYLLLGWNTSCSQGKSLTPNVNHYIMFNFPPSDQGGPEWVWVTKLDWAQTGLSPIPYIFRKSLPLTIFIFSTNTKWFLKSGPTYNVGESCPTMKKRLIDRLIGICNTKQIIQVSLTFSLIFTTYSHFWFSLADKGIW